MNTNPDGYREHNEHKEYTHRVLRVFIVFFVAKKLKMNPEAIISIIIEEALYLHRTIGPGMLENVYKTCLAYRLKKRGLMVEVEKPVPVYFEDIKMECGYRADIVVENLVVVDTKTIEAIGPLHIAQVLTYLQFLKLRHGLILNFYSYKMKDGIKRVLRGY